MKDLISALKTVIRLQISINVKGDVGRGAARLTTEEIADMAGVSVTTVSQVLNNKGSRFSEKARNKVLVVVAESHYKSGYFASNVINRHSKIIGMIVPDVVDFFFSKVIEGVEIHLNSLGYMILLCNSKHDFERAVQYVSELIHRPANGIIFATPNTLPENHTLKDRREHPIPTILVGRGTNPRDSERLVVKGYEGAHQAIHYLTQQGHWHIDMPRESTDYYRLTERAAAYQHALQDNNLPFRPYYVCAEESNLHGGYTAVEEVLRNEEITAIFCGDDEIAMGAYQAIEKAGKRIPNDTSVVDSNNLEISGCLVPSLTVVCQSSFDIGYYAVKPLVGAIVDLIGKAPNKVLDATFIVRKSIKPIQKTVQKQSVRVIFVFTRKK